MLRQRYGLVVCAKHRCVCSRRESLDWLRSSRTWKMFMNYWSRFLVLLLLMDPVYCSQRMLFQCYRTTNSEIVVKTCGTNFTDAYNPDRFHLRKSIRCIRAPSNCCVLFLVMLPTMVNVTVQECIANCCVNFRSLICKNVNLYSTTSLWFMIGGNYLSRKID
jgi:hypothetical protein